jgi:hypothetical protein
MAQVSASLKNLRPVSNEAVSVKRNSEVVERKFVPKKYEAAFNFPRFKQIVVEDKALRFFPFFHCFAGDYISELNKGGIEGLLKFNCDRLGEDADGKFFDDTYQPEKTFGLVRTPYPRNNISFGDKDTLQLGANFIYNIELNLYLILDIVSNLKDNGKYDEALSWLNKIVDPFTTGSDGKPDPEWKSAFLKGDFKETIISFFEGLNGPEDNADIINDFTSFDPHKVAKRFPLEYRDYVLREYVKVLILIGDRHFISDTFEDITIAVHYYNMGNHILGDMPQKVPSRGRIKTETYDSLKNSLNKFGNAKVLLENIFPFSGEITSTVSETGTLTGMSETNYFCYPDSERKLELWETIADRLYKIRHCQNFSGVERQLALWEPSIDPELLLRAKKQGLSLSSVLSDLKAPGSFYRFSFLLQKSIEYCAEVKAMGNALLSVIEKRDAEQLSILRAKHESVMLDLLTGIKERQYLEAKTARDGLLRSREATQKKMQRYLDLLGETSYDFVELPLLPTDLTAETELNAEVAWNEVAPDVSVVLLDAGETGVKVIPKEMEDLLKSEEARFLHIASSGVEIMGSVLGYLPNFSVNAEPFGVGLSTSFGSSNVTSALSAYSKFFQALANDFTYQAGKASKMASYIRREQQWINEFNALAAEGAVIDKNITSAEIKIQVAKKELENHRKQIAHSEEINSFLKGENLPGFIRKQSTVELYQWLKEQYFAVYKASYFEALKMAKKAEKAYQSETGKYTSFFIESSYWDNTYEGLASGEKLHLALRQMETSFLEENRREFELSKNISLAKDFPFELLQLKETGTCDIRLREEFFDLDRPGDFYRKFKTIGITLPCITGPYTSVSCTVRLLKNAIRVNTTGAATAEEYPRKEEGDDSRFMESYVPFTSIATSSSVNDYGMFEFNLRDEKKLVMEAAGVDCMLRIQVNGRYENGNNIVDLSQFDFESISDLILHVKYTAREGKRVIQDNSGQLS